MQAFILPGASQLFGNSSSSPASIANSIFSLASRLKALGSTPSYHISVPQAEPQTPLIAGAASSAFSHSSQPLHSIRQSISLSQQPLFRPASAHSLIFSHLRPRPVPTPKFTTNPIFGSVRSHFSTLTSVRRQNPYPRHAIHSQTQRHLSLFPRSNSGLPNVQDLARLSILEVEANNNPTDIYRQVAFSRACIEYGGKMGAEKVMSKWERMCEFDPSSPLLHSEQAFELYLRALISTNQISAIGPAVHRREGLIASNPLSEPLTSATESAPGPEGTAPLPTPVKPPSESQRIANAVLSDPSLRLPAALDGSAALGSLSSATSSSTGAGTSSKLGGLFSGLGSSSARQGLSGVKGNPVHVVLEESRGFVLWRAVRFIVLTCLFGFIALTFLSLLLENSGLLKAGPQQKEWEPSMGKTIKFSDVHGVDEAKDDLQEIVEFLRNPDKFSTLGGKLPKGVLLTGPPGTGKTLLAKAVAGEAEVPFLFASGSEFDEIFVGTGAKRVRELFEAARKKQPSIIFIDELDAIGSKRSSRDQHYMKQTLNQLLVELDGFKESEGVIVIAATNFPESLDKALVRPGRFDKKIVVPLPDITGRTQILKHHMRDVLADITLDPRVIARGTPGFSGAELQNLVNQAAIQASREGAKHVTLKHFEWAKDKIFMGAERRSAKVDEKEKRMTAYHEGGHALVALYTDGAMPLHKVTCVPRGHALGMTTQLPESDVVSMSFKEFCARLDVSMGGRVAEELVYGKENITSGAASDLQGATKTALSMVKHYGYSDKIGPVFHWDENTSPQKRNEIDSEVRSMLETSAGRAMKLLTDKRAELDRLAEALVEYETLNLDEVKKVVQGERIREDEPPLSTLDVGALKSKFITGETPQA